jgi:Tfp pilus assembly PilM family ATPase
MTIDKADILLGLTFVGKKLRAVELENSDGQSNIVTVAETPCDVPFDFSSIGSNENIPRFARAVNALVDEAGVRAKIALFALERRMVLTKKLKVDEGLSETEVKQHIEWELEQLLISSRDEYNVAFDRLGPCEEKFENIILVAVRKKIIEYLREIFSKTALKLSTVDVDLFAAIRTLSKSLVGGPHGHGLSALVDFNNRGIDFALIQNGLYLSSSELSASAFEENSAYPSEGEPEDIARMVNEEMDRLVSSSFEHGEPPRLQSIALYGDYVDKNVLKILQEQRGETRVDFADPFSSVHLRLNAEAELLTKEHPEKFLVSVGMVLV